jgi:hypothetical protein
LEKGKEESEILFEEGSAMAATVSSIANTGNSLAIDRVALSTEKLASVIKQKHLYDTWIKQADMWMRLGNPAKATDFLFKVEDHQKQEQEQAAPVTSVNFTAEEMAEQEQDKLSEPKAKLGNFSLVSQLEIIDDGTSTTTSTASKDGKMSAREKTIDDEKRNRAPPLQLHLHTSSSGQQQYTQHLLLC